MNEAIRCADCSRFSFGQYSKAGVGDCSLDIMWTIGHGLRRKALFAYAPRQCEKFEWIKLIAKL